MPKIYISIHPSMQEFLLCQNHFDVLALHKLATCCLVTAVIGSSLTTILNQISRKQWMDIAQLDSIVCLFVCFSFVCFVISPRPALQGRTSRTSIITEWGKMHLGNALVDQPKYCASRNSQHCSLRSEHSALHHIYL